MDERSSVTEGQPPTAPTRKWGEALEAGFQVLPNALVRHLCRSDTTPVDFVVLLNLLMAWWEPERMPYPRVSTIAGRMNVSARTVQRSLRALRRAGFITWDRGHVGVIRRRRFDLSPLVERAKAWAEHDRAFSARVPGPARREFQRPKREQARV
jgi:DNA-binding MarR family transcriptional regulator